MIKKIKELGITNFKELIKSVFLGVSILLLIDVINMPTFVMERFGMKGIALVIAVTIFLALNMMSLFKINVENYLDILLSRATITVGIYCVLGKLIFNIEFEFLLWLVIAFFILVILLLMRIFICKREKGSTKNDINVYDIKQLYDGKIDNNSNLIFLEENDVDYDLLSRDKIVSDLYNSISLCNNQKTFIVSLTGKWGSGKTTILNIVKKKLDKKRFIVVDKVNVWKYNNEEALIFEIIDEILKKLDISLSTLEIKKIVNCCVSLLASKTDININFLIKDQKILEKTKVIINRYLEKNDKRVVFIIDNFERTNTDNILTVLKIIATVLNMNRFIYVLSYDEDEMKKIFDEKLNINYDYMEKIVQLPLMVPEISQNDINKICTKCLQNLLIYYGVKKEEIEKYTLAIDLFNKNINNLRSFKRKINSMCNSCFYGNHHLNKIDMFLIELIKYENYNLYCELQRNYKYYVSMDQPTVYGYDGFQRAETFNQEASDYFDKLFSDGENARYKEILSLLFPNVKEYVNSRKYGNERVRFWNESGYIISKDKNEYRISITQRRIYNAKFFELYFTHQKNEFIDINNKLDEFIKWNNEKEHDINDEHFMQNLDEKLKEVLYVCTGVNQKTVIETLEVYVDKIEKNKLAILVHLIGMRECLDNTPIFLAINARRRLEPVCAEIIKNLSEKEICILQEKIEKDYMNLNFIKNVIYWLDPKNNIGYENQVERVFEKINSSYKKLISNIVENDINMYEESNYSKANIYCLMDNENYKAQLKYINERTVFKFLADMICVSIGNKYGYFLDSKTFNEIISYKKIDELLNKKDEAEMTSLEKFVKEVYEKSKLQKAVEPMSENIVYTDEYVDIDKL